jgi:hypothetical protein
MSMLGAGLAVVRCGGASPAPIVSARRPRMHWGHVDCRYTPMRSAWPPVSGLPDCGAIAALFQGLCGVYAAAPPGALLRVSAAGGALEAPHDTPDLLTATLEYDDGGVCEVTVRPGDRDECAFLVRTGEGVREGRVAAALEAGWRVPEEWIDESAKNAVESALQSFRLRSALVLQVER